MPSKKPTKDEFQMLDNGVLHVPTNAGFTSQYGGTELTHAELGGLGSVLPNGDDYRDDEVAGMATLIWKGRSVPT